jgi:serine/threonine protein kinase
MQSRVYTLMSWYEGETLEARLRRGLPSIAEGLAIATRLARGIIALHRLGVIHRDIKPDNVLVEKKDGGVRLIDFGVARIPQMEDAEMGDVPGSHGYLAPELYRGERGDEASDQFAFGVTLYRIFTGHIPFTDLQRLQRPGYDSPADPASLRPDLPAWLAVALRRSVQVNADDRYSDMIELVQVLESGTARAASRRRPLSLFERKPVLVWQLLSLVLVLALALVLALVAARLRP